MLQNKKKLLESLGRITNFKGACPLMFFGCV